MITSRFRSLVWVGVFATASLGCYIVTQKVAGERAQLAKVERQILLAKRDVRRLETEIETRSRLPQLEQWNQEVLALSAPRAAQFLGGEVQLASFEAGAPLPIDPAAAPPPSAVRLASAVAPAPAAKPAPAIVPVAAVAETGGEPMLRRATYLKPKGEALAAVKPVALKDAAFVADLEAMAASETGGKRRGR